MEDRSDQAKSPKDNRCWYYSNSSGEVYHGGLVGVSSPNCCPIVALSLIHILLPVARQTGGLLSRALGLQVTPNEPSSGQAPRYRGKGLRPDVSGRHPSSQQAARNCAVPIKHERLTLLDCCRPTDRKGRGMAGPSWPNQRDLSRVKRGSRAGARPCGPEAVVSVKFRTFYFSWVGRRKVWVGF